MKVYKTVAELGKDRHKIVLVIGNFDGLHRGHLKIIDHAVSEAGRRHIRSLVLTFERHTAAVLKHKPLPASLMTNEDKVRCLAKAGVDAVYFMPFNRRTARITADKFIEFLCSRFAIAEVCVGANFRFGRSNSGDIETLHAAGKRFGFTVKSFSVEKDRSLGRAISSTAVREYLLSGRPDLAARMLGHPYALTSTIVRGLRLGTALGFPTANFDPRRTETLIPADGVYEVVVSVGNTEKRALTYIGPRTILNKQGRTIETHIPGHKKPLYGKKMTLNFIRRIRPAYRFDSPEDLKEQIENDIRKMHSRRL